MRNKFEENKTDMVGFADSDHIFYGLFLLSWLFILTGCNKSLRSTDYSYKKLTPVESVSTLKPKAFQIISQGLSDENPAIRVRAIEVVASTEKLDLMPEVQKLLKDDFVPVRFAAALAMGDRKYYPAADKLEKLLKDEDKVKMAAAYALDKLGSYDSFSVLGEAITSKDQTVRANATMLLGKTGSEKALKPLYWALRDEDSGYKVRFQAAEAIASLGDEKILRRLWAMALSAYADDRVVGVKAIGALGTIKAKEVLITKLDDKVLEVRLTAAEQLGVLGDTTGGPEVLDVFTKNLTSGMNKQDMERINILTALAIGRIATSSLTCYLPELIENESKYVRIAAAAAVFHCTN
ncbi:MAG: HEAT repeat domain-containing protein [Planctomycetota bacterium]|jgi:HEAT repeat protein